MNPQYKHETTDTPAEKIYPEDCDHVSCLLTAEQLHVRSTYLRRQARVSTISIAVRDCSCNQLIGSIKRGQPMHVVGLDPRRKWNRHSREISAADVNCLASKFLDQREVVSYGVLRLSVVPDPCTAI